jgi:hypothetical protein
MDNYDDLEVYVLVVIALICVAVVTVAYYVTK